MCDGLQLKSTDIGGCDVISALVQDALFQVEAHSFHKQEKCVRFLVNRFCWDKDIPDILSDDEQDANQQNANQGSSQEMYRVHSGIYIYNVESVRYSDNFIASDKNEYINMLSMHASDNEINILCSNNKHIYITVSELCVYLKDLHDKYITVSKPSHDIE